MKRIHCPLCNSKESKVLYKSTLTPKDYDLKAVSRNLLNTLDNSRKHGQYVKCTNCSLLFVNPPDNQKLLNAGYRNVIDKTYIKTEAFRKKLSQRHLKSVKAFKSKGKLLDVGCFTGIFLELAKNSEFIVEGIEPSIWASEIAMQKGINIIGKEVAKTKLKPLNYDVVTLWDVIEHLSNPNEAISLLVRSLKKDGIIALGTPDAGSMVAKLMGSRFPYLVRMHVMLFSRKTLRQLLESHGLKVIYTKSYGRTFPLTYIINRLPINKILIKTLTNIVDRTFLKTLVLTVDLGDSFIMVAQKK